MRVPLLTLLALLCFAANSVLCRLALLPGAIDPASFTALRVASGAAALVGLTALLRRRFALRGTWRSAALLFAYAAPFSFAYLSLTAGTGALLLFGSVQCTMLVAALVTGERPHALQWGGLALALAGLVYLVLPGLSAPPPGGAALMVLAGIAWGFYSLRGRGTADPLTETASNFVRAAPLALVLSLCTVPQVHGTPRGIALALCSGALTSGVGYVLWYAALTGLSATRAATVQLPVPVLTALGGVVFLAESLTLRLVLATALILGGVCLALRGKERRALTPAER